MTHFQVPEGRTFNNPKSKLKDWPGKPEDYRLFVGGNSGEERIGVHTRQKIELQLTGGKGYQIETTQSQLMRAQTNLSGQDVLKLADKFPSPVGVSDPVASGDRHSFTLAAKNPGVTNLFARDAASNEKARLTVAVGDFQYHDDMKKDLIAETCRGSDSLKILALQRMLNNVYLGKDASGNDRFSNAENIFEQHAPSNSHATFGNMACGIVAQYRGEEIIGKVQWFASDPYLYTIHEPLGGTPRRRSDVKYRPERIQTLVTQIMATLDSNTAVRVGVVDSPTRMTPKSGKLVAYESGGHSVLIVGYSSKAPLRFLYIDPWGGGSKMQYKGGIAGNKFATECPQLGLLVVTHDPSRQLKPGDSRNNIIKQDASTQYSFSDGAGNFLEVVSSPFLVR